MTELFHAVIGWHIYLYKSTPAKDAVNVHAHSRGTFQSVDALHAGRRRRYYAGITGVDARNTGVDALNVIIISNGTVHTTGVNAACMQAAYARMQPAFGCLRSYAGCIRSYAACIRS